jgi:hypothetical protein
MMGEVSWDPKRRIQSSLCLIDLSFAMFFVLKIFKTELHEKKVSPRGITYSVRMSCIAETAMCSLPITFDLDKYAGGVESGTEK